MNSATESMMAVADSSETPVAVMRLTWWCVADMVESLMKKLLL